MNYKRACNELSLLVLLCLCIVSGECYILFRYHYVRTLSLYSSDQIVAGVPFSRALLRRR